MYLIRFACVWSTSRDIPYYLILVPRLLSPRLVPAAVWVCGVASMCRMILSVYDTKRTGEPAVQPSDANAAATPIEAPATAP